MTKIRQALLVALIMTSTSPAMAFSEKSGTYVIMGAGNSSCGTWAQDRKDPNKILETVNNAWVLGFITAIDSIVPGTNNLAEGTDAAGLFGWIDNYCASNPLSTIESASQELASHLIKRQSGKP